MPSDFDQVLISIRCSNCARAISAPLVEVRETGVVGCICGTVTRARYEPPVARTPFSRAVGWHRKALAISLTARAADTRCPSTHTTEHAVTAFDIPAYQAAVAARSSSSLSA